jgi:hypothetical protein
MSDDYYGIGEEIYNFFKSFRNNNPNSMYDPPNSDFGLVIVFFNKEMKNTKK